MKPIVKMWLILDDLPAIIPVAKLRKDGLVLEEPYEHPPGDGEMILRIEPALEHRWRVRLPDGISPDSLQVKAVRITGKAPEELARLIPSLAEAPTLKAKVAVAILQRLKADIQEGRDDLEQGRVSTKSVDDFIAAKSGAKVSLSRHRYENKTRDY
jgi:hypothetical protein